MENEKEIWGLVPQWGVSLGKNAHTRACYESDIRLILKQKEENRREFIYSFPEQRAKVLLYNWRNFANWVKQNDGPHYGDVLQDFDLFIPPDIGEEIKKCLQEVNPLTLSRLNQNFTKTGDFYSFPVGKSETITLGVGGQTPVTGEQTPVIWKNRFWSTQRRSGA